MACDEAKILDSGVYNPKSVLVTGGAGFIASNCVCHLVTSYPAIKFICMDKLDYCSSIKNLDEIKDKSNFLFIESDILIAESVLEILYTHQIDTIMHFAAQTHVDNSFGNSLDFTRNNVLGTHVLLEATVTINKLAISNSLPLQIKRFIHVSTDEVFGTPPKSNPFFLSSTQYCATNPYSASKAAAEILAQSFYLTYSNHQSSSSISDPLPLLPLIITRSSNVFGPKQFPEKLIPKFITLLSQNQKISVHGDGHHQRCYLFSEDSNRAFEFILLKGRVGETYNLSSDQEYSNKEIALMLLQLFNKEQQIDHFLEFVEDRPYNDESYSLDGSSLRKLGFETPQKSRQIMLQQLQQTIDWYRGHGQHWDEEVLKEALVPHPRIKANLSNPFAKFLTSKTCPE